MVIIINWHSPCGHGPYGPGPIWARALMGQGPYGPGPIWARAHRGQGPYGPRALPCRANTSPKNAPWKKESKLCFLYVFWKQKRCATSIRSFWRRYRAEISAMCQKTKVSVFEKKDIIWSIICPRNLLPGPRNLLPGKCPSDPTSTCAGGQDDVSSQANSLKLCVLIVNDS